ncbi:MAG TPA: hypothetical protein VFQ39_03115 [Longimicrobium sp.]|nr:hypothetical protein [Longimicrobium sp.]
MLRAFIELMILAFRHEPRKAVVALLDPLKTHPVVVFQAVVFARAPSLTSAAMFVLGSLANNLIVNIALGFRGARTWMALRREVLDKFRGFTFREVPVDRYLDGPARADMEFWLVGKVRGAAASLNDVVKVHVWRRPGTVVANLASYSVPLGDSHIFLSDEPESVKGIRRYQVLHEIGHALVRTGTNTVFVETGMVPALFFAAWYLAMSEWTIHTLTGGLAYLAVLAVWRADIVRQRRVGRLTAEVVADGFAVSYLSAEDCRATAASPMLGNLKDRELSATHNAVRLERLREMLALKAAGDLEGAFRLSVADVELPTLDGALSAILLFGAMALYATPPDGRTVAWTAALTGALLFFSLVLQFQGVASHAELRRHLEARGEPAPA